MGGDAINARYYALLFSPFVPDSRIIALRDLLDLFYVAQASVVGMFMGVKAYMTRKM